MRTSRNTPKLIRRPNEELLLIEEEPSSTTPFINSLGLDPCSTTYPRANVYLEWKNLSVRVRSATQFCTGQCSKPTGKLIISNVSGAAHPGSLLAILGSSGCGKTTLLNALTLRSQSHLDVEGSVLVDGHLISPGQMDAISAYVQQDDLFGGLLTVKEQLTFQALLRMDRKLSRTQKLQRVQEIIREMGLTNCQDTLIGVPGRTQSISGGERRRLAFACEVLTDPLLLLCDEPTSGLDTAMAENVVSVLRKMAAKGKTVLCTIHQPSSYQYALFDRILLMADGRIAFCGTPKEALDFFTRLQYPCPLNYNPADHFIHVLAGINGSREDVNRADVVQKFCREYASMQEAKTAYEKEFPKLGGAWQDLILTEPVKSGEKRPRTKTSRFKASVWTQIRAVMWRSWLCVVRDTTQWKIRTLESLFLGIFFGLIYKNQHEDQLGVYNVSGLIAVVVSILTFQAVFAVVQGACDELPLFFREHCNGMYRTEVYILCRSLADIPASIVFPFLLGFFPFWMMGTNNWSELLIDTLVILLIANICISFGYLMTSITSALEEALAVIPFFMCPMFLASGFFINLRSVPKAISWLRHLSWFKYGNEILSINHWKDVTHIECNINNSTCPRDGRVVLQIMNFDPDNLHFALWMMVLLIFGYRLLGLVVLSFRAWRKN